MATEIKNATLVTPNELYEMCSCPEYVGQTSCDENWEYKMYWRVGNKTYYTNNKL